MSITSHSNTLLSAKPQLMPEMLLSFCICLSWRDSSPAAADEEAIFSLSVWAGVFRYRLEYIRAPRVGLEGVARPTVKAKRSDSLRFAASGKLWCGNAVRRLESVSLDARWGVNAEPGRGYGGAIYQTAGRQEAICSVECRRVSSYVLSSRSA